MTKRININNRNLLSHKTGVQRYTEEIIKRFPSEEYQALYPNKRLSSGIKGHIWEQFLLPLKMSKNGILWSPSNTGPISIENQILTIHDLVPFDHPEWLNSTFVKWYKFIQPILAKRVKKIITISNFSKERILHHFKINENKVTVIYNGIDDAFFLKDCKSNRQIDLPSNKYILSLGSLEPRKNLNRLLKAWKNLNGKIDDDIWLIIVGKKGSEKVFRKVDEFVDLKNVHFTGYVEDRLLPSLYSKAIAFCYLSEYEGFGLPPIEAMAAGTAVVVGNKTAIPEIVGEAGILVNPFSVTEIEYGLISLIENRNLRREYELKGNDRAKMFSWDETSSKTWEIINNF